MKKTPDISATLVKGASEAREILEQTATLIDAEWQRLLSTIDESETVPDQIKQAVDRFDTVVGTARREASTAAEDLATDFSNTIDEMREFVATVAPNVAEGGRRAARQFGVPVPDAWPWESADEADEAHAADVEAGDVKVDTVKADVAEKPAAKKKAAKKPPAKTVSNTAKNATKSAKTAAKKTAKKASATKTSAAKATKKTAKSAGKTAKKVSAKKASPSKSSKTSSAKAKKS